MYSSLAIGLTRDWSERTYGSETDQIQKSKYDATAETDAAIEEKHGVPRIHIAIVWLL